MFQSIILTILFATSGLAHKLNAQPKAWAPGTPLHLQPLAANNVYTKPNTPLNSPGRLTILSYTIYPATGSPCCKCKSSHCATYANETIWNVDQSSKANPQIRLAVAGEPQTVYLNNDYGYLEFNNVGQTVPNDTSAVVTNFGALKTSGGKTFLGSSFSTCPDAYGDYTVGPVSFASLSGCYKIKVLLADPEVDGTRIGAYNYGPGSLPSCCNDS